MKAVPGRSLSSTNKKKVRIGLKGRGTKRSGFTAGGLSEGLNGKKAEPYPEGDKS